MTVLTHQRIVNSINGRLSLRAPQHESLEVLAKSLEIAPDILQKEKDLDNVLKILHEEFDALSDFERDFPSLCFALATGVGKTRLMGAFIAYLHLAYGIKNFFVLAPNLTIYDKLITDFTPNTPKYVFKGIAEFSVDAPRIITGDNYEQQNISGGSLLGSVDINIFNISKINSEVRGGKAPRIKRLSEYLGDSYFSYLASLPDLVMIMDESHRYRASAGIRAINELKPLMGLELTATPFTESSRGPVQFKNVVVDYPLARAMDDGFVKEPAVVTQKNFDVSQYTPEQVEKIKLEDGIRLHEITKVDLLTYAKMNELSPVKPFMLVIARDITHAAQLLELMESDSFFEGRYKGKVIQVDSSKSGAAEEEMIRRLLDVESFDEPTEVVIHVNMLKEGWDVTNLYTIVPLRAANARTLIEQSIGRGLRLPYGKRTGEDSVDRLNIVAHDKFQEIVDEANDPKNPIRLKQIVIGEDIETGPKESVQVTSTLESQITNTVVQGSQGTIYAKPDSVKPVFAGVEEQKVAMTTVEVISSLQHSPDIAPNSLSLLSPEVQAQVLSQVEERITGQQRSLLEEEEKVDLAAVVEKATALVVQETIDIPRVVVVPKGDVTYGYNNFDLDLSKFNLQASERDILLQNLHTNEQLTVSAQVGIKEDRLEDYIVHSLIDYDDISYEDHADLIYDLSGQVVKHLQTQDFSEDEVINILDGNRVRIADLVHAQMTEHFWEEVTGYDVEVRSGFTDLRKPTYSVAAGESVKDFRETVSDVKNIRKMLFGGFKKCLHYPQKFDSDTERRFSIIVDRDSEKWFKPANGQFKIFYKSGNDHKEYIPDFVAEGEDFILMAETKASVNMEDPEVLSKAEAASEWCRNATEHSKKNNGKSWHYSLIPHDAVAENKSLKDFVAQYEYSK